MNTANTDYETRRLCIVIDAGGDLTIHPHTVRVVVPANATDDDREAAVRRASDRITRRPGVVYVTDCAASVRAFCVGWNRRGIESFNRAQQGGLDN